MPVTYDEEGSAIVDAEAPVVDEDHLQLTQPYRTNIAANVRRHRALAGWRQKDLARILNAGQGHVGSVEMAKLNIGLHTLTRLANAFNVEPWSLLLPVPDEHELAPAIPSGEPSDLLMDPGTAPPRDTTLSPKHHANPAPELLASNFAVGVNITTVKQIVAATHRRLEALERRHGSVPMTREMLTSVLVALLNASQNVDGDAEDLS